MSIVKQLIPEDELDLIDKYIYYNNPNTVTRHQKASIETVLSPWATAKSEVLLKAFNNQLILKKKFEYDKDKNELDAEMANLVHYPYAHNTIIENFVHQFRLFIRKLDTSISDDVSRFVSYDTSRLLGTDTLIDNKYQGPDFVIPAEYTINNKSIKIQNGCKPLKALSKIVENCGLNKNDFEEFRLEHSRILNQKTVTGTLCLSIHPLDYMTMSDNDEGWESCMSWENNGEYRAGTVEMMNSPYVIVAYIESDNKKFTIGDDFVWNSKKWRQLIMVTPELILGNKQYPYTNHFIETEVLKWVKELMEKIPEYQGFSDTISYIRNEENCYYDEVDSFIYFELYFNAMYNDIYDDRAGFLNKDYFQHNRHYDKNYSGIRNCMWCGNKITRSNKGETGDVCCRHCLEEHICDNCYEIIYGDENVIIENRTVMCLECYSQCAE